MPASILKNDASLANVLEEATYTHAILAANPLTAVLAADFDPIVASWTKVDDQETQLRIALVKAQALVSAADDGLDQLVDAVTQTVLLDVKNDRKAPQYQLYFGAKAPGELKRPVLGGQLETMRGWIPSLQASANPALKDLGTQLQARVVAADAVVKSQGEAEQANRDFRTIGPRRAFIDNLNALRKVSYGKLSEMPHADPSKHLPASFAEGFFRHDSRKAKATAAELGDSIAELEAQLATLKEQLAKTAADEEAAAKAKSEAAAHAASIAQATKDAQAAASKLAALKAKKKKK